MGVGEDGRNADGRRASDELDSDDLLLFPINGAGPVEGVHAQGYELRVEFRTAGQA